MRPKRDNLVVQYPTISKDWAQWEIHTSGPPFGRLWYSLMKDAWNYNIDDFFDNWKVPKQTTKELTERQNLLSFTIEINIYS